MSSLEGDRPWYRDGLRFECTRCGACCTGAPGFVWVGALEIQKLAEFLGLSAEAFAKQYVRQVGQDLSLIEKPGGDCIFWTKDKGCNVYPARPVQCQTWPFWSENLETPDAWKQVERVCPGSARQETGRWFSLDEIRASAARISS